MLTKEERLGLRTWIEVDRAAIANNHEAFRTLVTPAVKVMGVVKSNAYGHGLVGYSKELCALGIDWLAVDSIVEGLRLRKEGVMTPILVLGYTLPERIQEAIDQNISITLSSMFSAESLLALPLSGKIKVHVKVDSGMHRQGFMEHERESIIAFLKQHSDILEVEGLYTHFASAKDPAHPENTKKQLSVFEPWIAAFRTAGFAPIIHAAATGAALVFPETHFDMVRIGIGLHGVWPSHESGEFSKSKVDLVQTLSWKTIVGELKTIPPGEGIGYDLTEVTKGETNIAVCPIGYWHGFSRSLSSIGEVLVGGRRARVLGRVSMDMIVVDVTGIPGLKIGDEVTLVGKQGEDFISVDEISKKAGVSSYEFITRINPLIKKFYL